MKKYTILNQKHKNKIVFNIAGVTAINALMALVALLKDVFIASYMATTSQADAFTLAFFITDMIGNVLIANAAGISCVPLFSEPFVRNDDKGLRESFAGVNVILFILSGIVGIVLLILDSKIISLLGIGFFDSTKRLSVQLFQILLPTILMYPLVFSAISFLQVRERYIASAAAPLIFNFVLLIGVAYCLYKNIPLYYGVNIVAFSVVAAVVSMLIFTYSAVYSLKDHHYNILKLPSLLVDSIRLVPYIIKKMKIFWVYLCVLFSSQIVYYIERYLASQHNAGSVAAQNYAYRLSQFPVWIFTAAIGTVVYPMMSRSMEEGQRDKSLKILKTSLWLMMVVTLPIIVILYILRIPIVSILFQRGAFNSASVNLTATILSGYVPAIMGQSIIALCLKYYIAEGSLILSLCNFILSSSINILSDFYLVQRVGLKGLGYGAAIGSLISAILFLFNISKRQKFDYSKIIMKIMRIIPANFLIIILAAFYRSMWEVQFMNSSSFGKVIFVLIVSTTCIGAYSWVLKRSRAI